MENCASIFCLINTFDVNKIIPIFSQPVYLTVV